MQHKKIKLLSGARTGLAGILLAASSAAVQANNAYYPVPECPTGPYRQMCVEMGGDAISAKMWETGQTAERLKLSDAQKKLAGFLGLASGGLLLYAISGNPFSRRRKSSNGPQPS